MTKQMNNEHIRVAAYYLWQKAGCPNGMENDFWFQDGIINSERARSPIS